MRSATSNCPDCRKPLVEEAGSTEAGRAVCPGCGRKLLGPVRRRALAVWIAMILGMVGVSVLVFSRHLPGRQGQALAQGTAPAAGVQGRVAGVGVGTGLHSGAVRTRMVLLREGEGDQAKTVVALGKPTGTQVFREIRETDQGMLARELIRQSLLIAARDEMGLATRDEVLGDASPTAAAGDAAIEITSVFLTKGESRVTIRRQAGDRVETLFDRTMGPVPNEVGILAKILPIAEELSRTEFPKVLRQLGLGGKPNQVAGDEGLPAEVEARQTELGFVGNFAALRDLHGAIRGDGESPARLGALARGYALLGALTEFQWHPAHKGFSARALLYAERLVARQPNSAGSLRNRAYVKSLVGLHQEALEDLAAASTRAQAAHDATPPPAWVPVIEAYARDDRTRLGAVVGPYAKLASLLKMLALEFAMGDGEGLHAAIEVVGIDPDCYRAHDAMCRAGGVSNLHRATLAGPESLAEFLPEKLRAVDSLPAEVRQRLDRDGGSPSLARALALAGAPGTDAGEPSWGVLGHLIRETHFVQVARRLIFMKMTWSVPVDDYWAEVKGSVADHPYRPFLESFALPPQDVRETFIAFANAIDLTELEGPEFELVTAVDRFHTNRERHDSGFSYAHGDAIARDLGSCTQYTTTPFKIAQAKVLLAVSPHSSLARSVLITNDWDSVKDRAEAWSKDEGASALLLGSLAGRYADKAQYDKVEPLLRRCIELTHGRWAYEGLAGIYKKQGDLGLWRSTLDDYLADGEDTGLDHAGVQVVLANDLMDRKQWNEALPYAEAAAQTGAGWAMECAARCNEGLGDWKKAEQWTMLETERYPESSWPHWYLFCQRTGHGDLEGARAWVQKYLDDNQGRSDRAGPMSIAYFAWMNGDLKKARDGFVQVDATKPSAGTGIPLALIRDQMGEPALAAEALDRVLNATTDQQPKGIAVYRRLRESLADGGKTPLDLEAVDTALRGLAPDDHADLDFILGRFLVNHGQVEAARKYLARAAESPKTYLWLRAMAAVQTRELAPKPKD